MSIANRTYKDMAYSMFANPMSGDMGKKTGAGAVKGAIVSILKTNFNPITEERIKTAVEDAVKAHEPRAQIIGITVEGQEEQNRYLVSILFNVTSIAQPQKLETYFERV
jgi:hypothetical protein